MQDRKDTTNAMEIGSHCSRVSPLMSSSYLSHVMYIDWKRLNDHRSVTQRFPVTLRGKYPVQIFLRTDKALWILISLGFIER